MKKSIFYLSFFLAIPVALLAKPGDLRWKFQNKGGAFSSAAIGDDGTVYISSEGGKIYALDGDTGHKKWDYQTGGHNISSPAIGSDGTVYVPSGDGLIYALNGASGAKLWVYPSYGVVASLAIGINGLAYMSSRYNTFFAFDAFTGQGKWEFPSTWPHFSSAAVGADGIVYVGQSTNFYAFDGTTGRVKWTFQSRLMHFADPAIDVDGTVFVGSSDGNLYALNGTTGAKIWETPIGEGFSSPAIGADGTIFAANAFGRVLALDRSTGIRKWEFLAHSIDAYFTPAIGADGTVYIGENLGLAYKKFFALDGSTGTEKWTFEPSDLIEITSSPAIGLDGTVYFGAIGLTTDWTHVGTVYALESSSVGGLAKSSWPKFRGNARNTGQVAFPPRILSIPASGVLLEGTATNLSAQVAAEPPADIQWFLNNQLVPGATNSSYLIPSVSTTNGGTYWVTASNRLGMAMSDSATFGIHNVLAYRLIELILHSPAGAPVELHYADSLVQPVAWQPLTNLTLTTSPFNYIDFSATNSQQRFYRASRPERLAASILHGWNFTEPAGSRFRIDYTDAELGYTNWIFVTNLTLTSSPQLFIDPAATNSWPRYYRKQTISEFLAPLN